jgi:hypothetical protein
VKTKISKILGVGLALIMVFSLAFALMPTKAQADEGNMTWVAQPLPTVAYNVLVYGSNVTEFAVANDGKTIYAINGARSMTTNPAADGMFSLYKSVNAGQTWVGIDTRAPANGACPGAVAAPLGNVAVSPTSADIVAISSRDAAGATVDTVWVSSSGGISFAPLPTLDLDGTGATIAWGATQAIMDLKVGPDRADAILQREYLIACSSEGGGVVINESSLKIIGAAEAWGATGTAWAYLDDSAGYTGGVAHTPTADYIACEFSPSYLGQRTVVAVGVASAAAAPAPLGAGVFVFNTQSGTLLNAATPWADQINNVPRDLGAGGANDIVCADIALSTDFDFATPGYDKVYASLTYAGVGTAGGVYRVEQGLPVAPILAATQPIRSITYAGDSWGGTLFAGDYATTVLSSRVRYTTQPVINAPTWYPSRKSPTGAGGRGYVRVSPNFLTDQTVYAGTTSAVAQESAFSVSTDAGVSFNQESLIDLDATNTTVAIDAFALTPDGTTIYVLTNDDDGAGGVQDQFSLWKSALPVSPFSWVRVFCANHVQNVGAIGRLAINRAEWGDNPEIYVAETPTVALTFYVSADGGNLWANRSAPVIPGAAIAMIWAEKQKVAYVGIGANVFKTTSGGSGAWGPPVPTFVPAIVSVVALPGSDGNSHVLVGGTTGASAISIDGGTSFARLPPGLNAAGNYVVIPDEQYPVAGAEGENLLYAGDFAAANGLYRLKVGTDSLWESMANPTAVNLVGMGMSNGALYGMTSAAGGGGAAADFFTITATAALDAGSITVGAGTVSATITAGIAACTFGGINVPAGTTLTLTLTPGMGAVAYILATAADTIVVTATTANTSGTWTVAAADTTTALATDNGDGDAFCWTGGGAGTGVWSLPDAAVAGGAAAAGCDRTLVPHFAVGDMVWGTMNVPATAFPNGASPALFDVAQNKVYAGFAGAPAVPTAPELWAYNDYYATAQATINSPAAGTTIPVDPVTGRANLLPVTWNAVGTGTGLATNYLFAIFEESQGFPGAVLVATGAMPLPSAPSNAIYPWAVAANPPDINYTFVAGTTYGIMIAALNEVSGDAIMSPWSDPLFFDVEAASGVIRPPHSGPILNEPSLDATATGVDVGLSWAPMSGVTEYELVIATDAALTQTVAGTPVTLDTTSFGTTLDFDTIYYYGVRASSPTSSVQTTGTFTLAKPVEKYTCQYCGLTFDTRAELEAHIAAAHAPTTPLYIWIVIVVGAILVIAVIWLIFTTRRT